MHYSLLTTSLHQGLHSTERVSAFHCGFEFYRTHAVMCQGMAKQFMAISYSTIVLYGKDDEGVGVVYEDKSSQNHLCKPFMAT